MARHPKAFVRAMEPTEVQRLAAMQGRTAADAAAMFTTSPQYAREVITAFNEQALAALECLVVELDRVRVHRVALLHP